MARTRCSPIRVATINPSLLFHLLLLSRFAAFHVGSSAILPLPIVLLVLPHCLVRPLRKLMRGGCWFQDTFQVVTDELCYSEESCGFPRRVMLSAARSARSPALIPHRQTSRAYLNGRTDTGVGNDRPAAVRPR